MRKLLESWITLLVALASLVLSVIWYWDKKEIEPLIGIIASLGVLLTAGVYRIFPEKKEDPPPTFISKTEKNTVKDSILTAQTIQIGDHHHYADRKVQRNLTAPPFDPPVFLGRKVELQQVHDRLFAGENFLMLVNGQGGIGKTSFAAKYWLSFHVEYHHRAFLYVGDGIAEAMLTLAPALGVTFPDTMPTGARLQALLQAIGNLERPCLIVLDNANDPDDLDAHYPILRRCTNCHLLITSRLPVFREAAAFPINALPDELPLELFKRHYPRHRTEDDAIFWGISRAVGGNTLVVEILAKNLANINTDKVFYPLEKLLHDLQGRGLLRLTEQAKVAVDWQSFEKSTPEAIIAAMYDLRPLNASQLALLSAFAVLPPENIPYETLEALLAPDDPRPFSQTLAALHQTGWIERSAPTDAAVHYKCSPVVQEVVRAKNPDLLAHCRPLITALIKKTHPDVIHEDDYRHATIFTRYAESLIAAIAQNDDNLGTLCQNAGNFYTETGDLGKAAAAYLKMADIQAALAAESPGDPVFKNGLAISYEKLGETQAALGNLEKALTYYEKDLALTEELYAAYPTNVSFKNGLAISYSKLGDTQAALGNLDKALTYYEERSRLGEELYAAYPTNVSFKNGLAISYSKLGETQAALGNLEKALTYYEDYNRLEKELYAAYPTNVSFKNGLAISYEKLGNTQAALGNLEKAMTYYEDYNRLEKELHESYPTSVEFKNGLAISYSKLGETHSALGNLEQALPYYEKDLALTEELYAAYPTNVAFKNGLAISYAKLGDTQAALGNLEKALTYYEDVTALFEELYAAYPTNVAFKNGLAISYEKLGKTQAAMGNLEKALTYYEDRSRLGEELYAAYPTNVSFKNGLAVSYAKLAQFSRDHRKDKAAARRYFQQAEALWLELVRDAPMYAEFQRNARQVRDDLDALS